MNWFDVVIVIAVAAALLRGVQVGFVRQFCSTCGFFLGLFLGILIEGKVITLVSSPLGKSMVALAIVLGCALAGMAVGEFGGLMLKHKVRNKHYADRADSIFGAALGAITLLLTVWICAAIFHNVPSDTWQRGLRGSRLLALLNDSLPPAPTLVSRLGHLIDPNGFPQVFIGMEPRLETDQPLPDLGAFASTVEAVRPSIVKIEGEGCGGIVEGSGFVAGNSLVITNAHVVAGVKKPVVVDTQGAHKATPVWFDPDLDLAILRVQGLRGKPLPLKEGTAANNTDVVVLGYPGGGGFDAEPAVILESFTALGRDIYNQGETERVVYSVKANVREGNSGGPLIDKDGSVIGVVFAESSNYNKVGYALTTNRVIQELQASQNKTDAISTGNCAQ